MNLLETVLNANGGDAVRKMGQQFGLDDHQTSSALSALMPAIAGALQRNASDQDGLASLLGALSGGNHAQYLDDPSTIGTGRAVQEGNGILGHLFGSKEVSKELASRASAQTGIGGDILKQMLPIVAAMAMGGLSKQGVGIPPPGMPRSQAGAGILDMLTPLLDQNRDGSAVDDILGMASRFFGKR
ncbi:MAG: DUF937 domain-containing protein [Bryobacteraceae bacterium]|nr:DUF937 domain-containing protein [Bryobacteraceae bacterium]